MPPFGPGSREAGVRSARADAGALEVQGGLGHRPPVALATDEVGGVADRPIEEHLVEHRLPGHLAQRPDGDGGLVQREGEPRDAPVRRAGAPRRPGPRVSRSCPEQLDAVVAHDALHVLLVEAAELLGEVEWLGHPLAVRPVGAEEDAVDTDELGQRRKVLYPLSPWWNATGTPASASRAHTGSCILSPSERLVP
jgi:hypothetical protein